MSVPVVTAEILDQLDLTELIRERVDLIGLARYVAAGLRVPERSRESTGSLPSEAMPHSQIHGAEADQALAEWVDRVFRPRRWPGDDDPENPPNRGDRPAANRAPPGADSRASRPIPADE